MHPDSPPIHRRLAEIGLKVGGSYGFALGGGHAIAAHGILVRPSEDVDLFADWQRRGDFPAAVDEMIAAYRAEGFQVETDLRNETFARLHITDPGGPARHHRVELIANWRAHPPVQMDIGPVLHPDDVMAGKVDALYNARPLATTWTSTPPSRAVATPLINCASWLWRPTLDSTDSSSLECSTGSSASTTRTSRRTG